VEDNVSIVDNEEDFNKYLANVEGEELEETKE
jgi:hypothetical protein